MLDRSEIGKQGYLEQDFRLVHLKGFSGSAD